MAVPTSDEATPSAVAASAADEAGEGPVAHSNTTDLEKAMREAGMSACSSVCWFVYQNEANASIQGFSLDVCY